MNNRQISIALKKIDDCKTNSHLIEALVLSYHLNLSVLKYIFRSVVPLHNSEGKKPKLIVKEFSEKLNADLNLKSLITKKSFKSVKLWMGKMDLYFKSLKAGEPQQSRQLLQESEKIFALLHISLKKLGAR